MSYKPFEAPGVGWGMTKNQELPSDIQARIESADPVASEPVPAGWSRRNWVQREAVALGALIAEPDRIPAAD